MQEKYFEHYQNYSQYQRPQQFQRYPQQFQNNFKTKMKVLPFVLQLEDASINLISEREIQYLNQTKDFENNLRRFSSQNRECQYMQEPIRKILIF